MDTSQITTITHFAEQSEGIWHIQYSKNIDFEVERVASDRYIVRGSVPCAVFGINPRYKWIDAQALWEDIVGAVANDVVDEAKGSEESMIDDILFYTEPSYTYLFGSVEVSAEDVKSAAEVGRRVYVQSIDDMMDAIRSGEI